MKTNHKLSGANTTLTEKLREHPKPAPEPVENQAEVAEDAEQILG